MPSPHAPNTQYGTYPRENIAVRGIEGDIVAKTELGWQRICLMAGNALPHPAIGIDDCGYAVVGVAQNPAAVFDGPHARHVQVLPGSAGVAVPAIVADVHQHLGAQLRKLPHLVGKDRLIADENPVAMPFSRKTLRSSPRVNDETRPVSLWAKTSRFWKGMYSPKGTR